MLLELGQVLRVADDLEQVLVADKVEAREEYALLFEIVAQRLLDLGEHVGEPFEQLVHALDGEHVEHQRVLRHSFHQREKLGAYRLKLLRLVGQEVLDVGTRAEYALEIDPATLHVDPRVEYVVQAIELVLPRRRLALKLLHIW